MEVGDCLFLSIGSFGSPIPPSVAALAGGQSSHVLPSLHRDNRSHSTYSAKTDLRKVREGSQLGAECAITNVKRFFGKR